MGIHLGRRDRGVAGLLLSQAQILGRFVKNAQVKMADGVDAIAPAQPRVPESPLEEVSDTPRGELSTPLGHKEGCAFVWLFLLPTLPGQEPLKVLLEPGGDRHDPRLPALPFANQDRTLAMTQAQVSYTERCGLVRAHARPENAMQNGPVHNRLAPTARPRGLVPLTQDLGQLLDLLAAGNLILVDHPGHGVTPVPSRAACAANTI